MGNELNSRRSFVKKTFAITAGISIIPRHVMGGTNFLAPSDQLTKAVIGVGGMGQGHLNYEGTKLLAICDVDGRHLANTLKKVGPDVKGYRDFREVLARPDIDIVHIATPPHWSYVYYGGRSRKRCLVRKTNDPNYWRRKTSC